MTVNTNYIYMCWLWYYRDFGVFTKVSRDSACTLCRGFRPMIADGRSSSDHLGRRGRLRVLLLTTDYRSLVVLSIPRLFDDRQ